MHTEGGDGEDFTLSISASCWISSCFVNGAWMSTDGWLSSSIVTDNFPGPEGCFVLFTLSLGSLADFMRNFWLLV